MLNENILFLDRIYSDSEFDIQSFPFFKDYSSDLDKDDLFLPFAPNQFQNF